MGAPGPRKGPKHAFTAKQQSFRIISRRRGDLYFSIYFNEIALFFVAFGGFFTKL
jgi:hypothetical protein